ncbi:CNOT10 [Cordylochernes scorpioides]|uniref:CCR4-NOT transcription complex subunit 10 n=1 Tax=Cordylochernes scorpioides TaxID=51811 RepID=A0ABY6K4Y6_9ARAC|nr:CNOT10 [Cordylochernes scorpioides]
MSNISNKPCTDEEKEWSISSQAEFENGNYNACIDYLNKLLSKRPNDLKVHHNKAVAKFYQSRQRNVEELKDQLNILCSKANLRIDNLESLDDMEYFYFLYNKAILFYHNYQYRASVDIAHKLWTVVEPLGDDLSRKVLFLLLELYLSIGEAAKALELIYYHENLMKTDSSKEDLKSEDYMSDPFKFKLIFYKARCYLLLKPTKACKREIKQMIGSAENACAVFLRSQLDYLRGNYRKALKALSSSLTATNQAQMKARFEETGDMYTVMYFMNIANIHFKMGKPYLACFYNSKALLEHQRMMGLLKEEGKDSLILYNHNVSLRYRIRRNSAVFFLHTARPSEAFEYFLDCSHIYYTNPRIWLHLAECCIQKNKPLHHQYIGDTMGKENIGSGQFRKIVLMAPRTRITTENPAIPQPTLEFASICLKNAQILLDSQPNVETEDGLRCSVLTASAYVALCLGDIYTAANQAKSLFALPNLSSLHSFLGTIYQVEALVHMNNVTEAIQILDPEMLAHRDLGNLTSALQYTQALAYTLQENWERAYEILHQIEHESKEVPFQAILLAMYLHLQQGRGDLAKNIVKQIKIQFRERFERRKDNLSRVSPCKLERILLHRYPEEEKALSDSTDVGGIVSKY